MFIATFIIYFNKNTQKIESLSDYFLKDEVNENGKVERNILHTMGHQKLYDDLEKMNIPMANVIMKGLLFNDNNQVAINSLKFMNYFCVNNYDVVKQASLKNISVIDERACFSNIILKFILDQFDEDKFQSVMKNRVIGVNRLFKNSEKKSKLTLVIKDNQK